MKSSRLQPELIDITSSIKKLHDNITDETPTAIFKSSLFDLFASTSALEVGNENLDSSTIEISRNDVFDTKTSIEELMQKFEIDEKEECVYQILDYIFRSFMQWIHDNGSLTSNFISIGYVAEILDTYTSKMSILSTFESGDHLVDELLRQFVITLIFMIKAIGSNEAINFVVLEEEDIRLDSLGLNFFSEHDFKEYYPTGLKACIQDIKHERLKSLCAFVQALSEFIVFNMSTEYIIKGKVQFFDELISTFDNLPKPEGYNLSRFNILKSYHPQRTFSNTYPKKQIHDLESNGYQVLENIIDSFQKTVNILNNANLKTTHDFEEELYYLFTNSFGIGYDDSSKDQIQSDSIVFRMNVLNRVFLFQILISVVDDLTVNQISITQYVTNDVKSILMIDEDTESILLKGGEGAPEELQNELQSLKQVYLDSFLNIMRNPCYYRKSLSKQLLLWDSIQANISMFETPQNQDIKENLDEYPAISLWVYLKKMNHMIEFLLRGFGENLYSEWEYFAIYWNTFCIFDEKNNLLFQFKHYNELCKKRYEKQNQSKNLKKKYKDVEKRSKIKERNLRYIVQIENALTNISRLMVETEVMSLLCFLQCSRYIHLLESSNNKEDIIGHLQSINSTFIYDIRFKAFSSIGSPDLPKKNSTLVINRLLENGKSKEYINDCLQKLNLVKEKVKEFEGESEEKKLFWDRVLFTINEFEEVYGKSTSLLTNNDGLNFFKVENSYKSKTHEFFPTLF